VVKVEGARRHGAGKETLVLVIAAYVRVEPPNFTHHQVQPGTVSRAQIHHRPFGSSHPHVDLFTGHGPLPETANMPSATWFAECQNSVKASRPLVSFGVLIDNTIKGLTCLHEIISRNSNEKLILIR